MNENVKQAYLDKTTAQMKEWVAKIEVLKAKLDKESAGARIEYHAKIANWQEKESAFKEKLAEMRAAGESGFEAVKTGAQSVWNDLTKIMSTLEENKK